MTTSAANAIASDLFAVDVQTYWTLNLLCSFSAGFGAAEEGYIVLQDHGDPVWYRNIRVRRLP